MTFFANSGIAWPNYAVATQHAGTQSLEAFSEIWRLLAALEARGDQSVAYVDIDLTKSAKSLESAGLTYETIAQTLRNVTIAALTPAEYELAGLTPFVVYPSYLDASIYSLFAGKEIRPSQLYQELAQRTNTLAAFMKAFEPKRSNPDLVPQAFQFMRQLEVLSTLGRIIAVLNQRKTPP
jgi:hypothetical protein